MTVPFLLLAAVACGSEEADETFLYGPRVLILAPEDPPVVDSPVTIEGDAFDTDGLTPNPELEVLWNWTNSGASRAETEEGDPPDDANAVRFDWTPRYAGDTVLTLTVTDTDGKEGQDSLTVTVLAAE